MLSWREKERGTQELAPIVKTDPLKLISRPFEARDSILDDANAVAFHLIQLLFSAQRRAVRAKNDILAPKKKFSCKVRSTLGGADDHERLVAMLPTIAIGTTVSGDSVELPKAFDLRQFVYQPGRKQKCPRG